MTYPAVDPRQSFPDLEQQVLERWRERDVFGESMRRREGAEPYVFYEGPPTANGRPGSHHVLARVFKDIYPRYKTMQGHHVLRKGGWDCHGLPVEIAVENAARLHEQARHRGATASPSSTRSAASRCSTFLEEWKALTERIGFWVDIDDAYQTMDDARSSSPSGGRSSQLHERDLLYEGHKVVPYCARCGTALSSHEVAQGYKDVEDPSVYVKFPLARRLRLAAGVDDDAVDARLQRGGRGRPRAHLRARRRSPARSSCWPRRWSSACSARTSRSSSASPARDLVGLAYEPPFPFIPASEYGEKGHTVLPGDFVSDDDGTGIVHTAIAFGEDDYRLGAEQGLTVVNPVRLDGTYDERIGPYAGRWVKDADADLIEDLQARGRMFRAETLLHAYPHCWR